MSLTMSTLSLRQQHNGPSSPMLMMTLIAVVLLQLTLFSITSAAPAAVAAALEEASESNVAPRVRRELGEKRAMASWGKRESTNDDGVLLAAAESALPGELGNDELQAVSEEKRGGRKLAAWGKKRLAPQFGAPKAITSKWNDGGMPVWGKRSDDVLEDDEEDEEEKRDTKRGRGNLWGKPEDEIRRGWHNKGNLAVWG